MGFSRGRIAERRGASRQGLPKDWAVVIREGNLHAWEKEWTRSPSWEGGRGNIGGRAEVHFYRKGKRKTRPKERMGDLGGRSLKRGKFKLGGRLKEPKS